MPQRGWRVTDFRSCTAVYWLAAAVVGDMELHIEK